MNYEAAKIFSKLTLSDKKVRIKLLGDSITHGVGGTGWEQNGESFIEGFARSPESYCWAKLFKDHLEGQYNCEVINNGCSGVNIEFIIENFDTLVSPDDDIVVCTIGTNNRHQHFNTGARKTRIEYMGAFYKNILKLNDIFAASGKAFVLVANIPAAAENEKDGADFWRILHMNDIHDLYVKAWAECGFAFVDMYTEFISYCDAAGIDFATLLADGLHPNDAGYDVMFKIFLSEFGIARKVHNEINGI